MARRTGRVLVTPCALGERFERRQSMPVRSWCLAASRLTSCRRQGVSGGRTTGGVTTSARCSDTARRFRFVSQ